MLRAYAPDRYKMLNALVYGSGSKVVRTTFQSERSPDKVRTREGTRSCAARLFFLGRTEEGAPAARKAERLKTCAFPLSSSRGPVDAGTPGKGGRAPPRPLSAVFSDP